MATANSTDNFLFLMIAAIAVSVVVVVIIALVVKKILSSPFCYPYFLKEFDVSGKRNVDINDYIDRFLCDEDNRESLRAHKRKIENWKQEQQAYLETCHLKKRRHRQYLETIDDKHAFRFVTVRNQTRYYQRNYVKTPYKVFVNDSGMVANWDWLVNRNEQLVNINYEATLNEYHTKDQRKLMTPKLRQQIKERDNYTCQICGKYMPDEVGLHIDHIVPVSKGGKSVASNLRVLCSKCNSSKGAKIVRNGAHEVER